MASDDAPKFDDSSVTEEDENQQSWPYPPGEDLSWYRTHASIRVDMEEFSRAVAALLWRTQRGRALEEWEKANLSMWWKRFIRTVQTHHSYEEEFLYPWLATRAEFPIDKLSGDHDVINIALDYVSRAMTSSMWSQTPEDALAALEKIKHHFKAFQKVCLQHFEEEEEICVPMMRKSFSHQEARMVIHETMNRTMTAEDMSQIMRPMNREERKHFMRRENISSFKARFVLQPASKKYDRLYTAALQEIISGRPAKKAAGNWVKRMLSTVIGAAPEDASSAATPLPSLAAARQSTTNSYRTYTGSASSEKSFRDGADQLDDAASTRSSRPEEGPYRRSVDIAALRGDDVNAEERAGQVAAQVADITSKLAAVH